MSLLTARPSSAGFTVEDPCFLDTDEHPDWQRLYGNSQPLKLEIGFGMGDFLIKMAAREPDSNFIGIDFSQDGIRNLLARIKDLGLNNIRVVYGDVREKVPVLFKDGELDTVYINFPDPWPRKRHFKRRLIKPGLVQLVAQKLAPGGHVYLATDSGSYALEILEYFNAVPLLQNVRPESGFLEVRDLPKTKYEKSFIYAGDKIHYLEYFRLAADGQPEKPHENAPEKKAVTNDELLTQHFKNAEARARDACDLKRVADNLAEAGDPQWAGKVYRKAADKAEDSLDFNWLAYSVSEALGDKDWARELYKKAEDKAEGSLELNWLAYSVCETLGDTGWAKKLFEKAENAPGNIRELCDLADSISETIGDKEWASRLYKKAEENSEEHSDFYELADNIFSRAGDRQWASGIYQKAEDKAQDTSDLLGLAERLCGNLGDREWAGKVYQKAESMARDSVDFCGLADSLWEYLGDKDWAMRLYRLAESKAGESYEFRWLADSLCEKPADKDWARKIYKKAEDRAETFYEYRWLAERLHENLGDREWSRQVYSKAEGKARDPFDFIRLTNST